MILGCWPTLDAQIVAAEAKIAQLLPDTPFAPLTTVPGWGMSGPPITAPRWATPVGGREPASSTAPPVCHRHNTSRPGSVVTAASAGRAAWALRRALIDLGIGLWACRPVRPRLRPTAARPWQEGRRDRLGDGEPRQQDRLRPGSRPDLLRPRPPGRTTEGIPRSPPPQPRAGAVNLERPQRSEDERG